MTHEFSKPRLAIAISSVLVACGAEVDQAGLGEGGPGGKADELDEDEEGSADPSPTRYPVVLVHAFHATTTNGWSLATVAAALEAEGHFVHLASVPPYAGTPERAEALVDELDQARLGFCEAREPEAIEACFDATRVHIVGHSQGGLDARYAVGRLGYGPTTVSVTTLGAPHRGTPLGDLGLTLLGDPRARRSHGTLLTKAMDTLLGDLLDALRPQGLADAFYWLSEARFEDSLQPDSPAHIPDVETVAYQSWAAVATADGSLPDLAACEGKEVFPNGRAAELRGLGDFKTFGAIEDVFDEVHLPNDGHIPVASAKHGTFLGCVPADHLDLIGRPDRQVADNEALTGLVLDEFYRALGDRLAELEARDD